MTEQENKETKDLNVEILPDDFNLYDLSFKLIIIGDSGVGKSCLTLRATKNYFEDYYNATLGFEFFTFNIRIDGKYIKLQIWDTCGQEIYRSLISSFYRNSSLAMMVYAIDNENSWDHINNWLNEIKTLSNPDIKIFLIGNKADLDDSRKVSKEDADKFCQEHQLDLYMETSAKTGLNVKSIFVEAAKSLYNEHLKLKERSASKHIPGNLNQGIKVPSPKDVNKNKINSEETNKKGCC